MTKMTQSPLIARTIQIALAFAARAYKRGCGDNGGRDAKGQRNQNHC